MTCTWLSCIFCLLRYAVASPAFQADIPNADLVTGCNGERWPGVGHFSSSGGGARNPFGVAFEDAGKKWTQTLCEADSDGDGRSNGEELGDPYCKWTKGENPQFDVVTHPGVDCDKLQCTDESFSDASLLAKSSAKQGCEKYEAQTSKSHAFLHTPIAVPSERTSYFYQAFEWPEATASAVRKFEFVVDNQEVVHHMILYRCRVNKSAQWGIPARNPGMVKGCTDVLMAWAVGGNDFCTPEGVGFVIEPGSPFFVMQTHYDNPNARTDIVDQSGMRLHYDDNEGQDLQRAGVVLAGSWIKDVAVPPGKQNYHVRANIPASKVGSNAGTMFAHILHMHQIGRRITMTMIDETSAEKEEFACNSNYDFDLQRAVIKDEPYVVRPNQGIQVDCIYDSTSRTEITTGGESSDEEMCLVATMYYPEELGRNWLAKDITTFYDDAGAEHYCGCKDLNENNAAFYAHGVLMGLAWGLLLPAGVTFPLFWRFALPNGGWFTLHQNFQLAGTVAMLSGIVAMYIAKGGNMGGAGFHGTNGLLVIVLAVIQVLGGLCRPHKPEDGAAISSSRRMWILAHRGVAIATIIASIFQVYTGAQLMTRFGESAGTVLGLYGFCWLVVVAVAITGFIKSKPAQHSIDHPTTVDKVELVAERG